MESIEPTKGDIDAALAVAVTYFGGTLIGERRSGWRNKSVGSKIILDGQMLLWLRLQWSARADLNKRIWEGEVEANSIAGVRKPIIHDHKDWTTGDLLWRATLMTLIESEPCSRTPELRYALTLSERWLTDLQASLRALSTHQTDRINCRQDLITRRLDERFGRSVDSVISEWTTCHGDIHWANLTFPEMVILDWEGWGVGPRGLDPAFLLAFSLLQPQIAAIVEQTFREDLKGLSGRKAILFVCSELLRMIELYGDHPDLEEPLRQLATRTLESLQV